MPSWYDPTEQRRYSPHPRVWLWNLRKLVTDALAKAENREGVTYTMATTHAVEGKPVSCNNELYQDFLFNTLKKDPPVSVRAYLNQTSYDAAEQLGAYIVNRLAEVDPEHLLR